LTHSGTVEVAALEGAEVLMMAKVVRDRIDRLVHVMSLVIEASAGVLEEPWPCNSRD
jgi:hypothetical protein